MKANKNKRCGNYICFILKSGSCIAIAVDKTIAHTNRQYLKANINNEDWIYL